MLYNQAEILRVAYPFYHAVVREMGIFYATPRLPAAGYANVNDPYVKLTNLMLEGFKNGPSLPPEIQNIIRHYYPLIGPNILNFLHYLPARYIRANEEAVTMQCIHITINIIAKEGFKAKTIQLSPRL